MNTNDHLIDDMLSAFFKAELPKQWPALQLPAAEVLAGMPCPASLGLPLPQRARSGQRSRLALAASTALILGSFWYLSDRFDTKPAAKPHLGLEGGSATTDVLKQPSKTDQGKPIPNPLMP